MDLQCQSPAKEQPLPPNPNPNPNLRTVKSTAFKREERQKRKERKRQRKLEERVEEQLQTLLIPRADRVSISDPVAFSDIEWPCETRSDPDPGTTGWPAFSPNPLRSSSAEEQVRVCGPQAQQNGLRATREFLSKNEEEEEDDDDDDDDDDDEEECDDGIFKFFEGLFENDRELRGFYEKRWEKREFACLVCERRFTNCVGLVQHSNTVSKKRRGAHRALGRAVCRALGWDVHQLPGILIDEPQKPTAEPIEVEKEDAMEEEETVN